MNSSLIHCKHSQASVSALESVHVGSTVLYTEIQELSTCAEEVSEQVC